MNKNLKEIAEKIQNIDTRLSKLEKIKAEKEMKNYVR
jgi:hypothetical protein